MLLGRRIPFSLSAPAWASHSPSRGTATRSNSRRQAGATPEPHLRSTTSRTSSSPPHPVHAPMAAPKPPTLSALFALRLTLLDLLPSYPTSSQKASAHPLLSLLSTSSLPPSLSSHWLQAFSLHSTALLGPHPAEGPATKKRKLDPTESLARALEHYSTALSLLDTPPLPNALAIPLLSDIARALASHARSLLANGDTPGALAGLARLSRVLARSVEAFKELVRRGGKAQMKEVGLMDMNAEYGDAWEGLVRAMNGLVELVSALGEGVGAGKRCEELGNVVEWFEGDLARFAGREEGRKGKSWVEQEGRDAVVWEVEQLLERAAVLGFEIGSREVQQRRRAAKANLPALCATFMEVDEVKLLGERGASWSSRLVFARIGLTLLRSRQIQQEPHYDPRRRVAPFSQDRSSCQGSLTRLFQPSRRRLTSRRLFSCRRPLSCCGLSKATTTSSARRRLVMSWWWFEWRGSGC